MALNDHITVYYQHQLICSTEPAAANNNLAVSTNKSGMIQHSDLLLTGGQKNPIYPNPITSRSFSIRLTDDLAEKDVRLIVRDSFGKAMQSSTYRGDGSNLHVPLTRAFMPGVYNVQVNDLAPLRLLVNLQ